MPYSRSNYSPYLAMRDLSNTLYSGLSGIGQQKIQAEDRSFNRMLQENQLGRQVEADTRAKEMYAAQKPGMELKAMEDKAKLERLESPVTLGELAVDQYGLDLWTNVPKGDSKSLTEKFGDMFGAKYDTDPKSETRGKFVKADGTPLKRKDLEPKWQEFNQLVTSHIDPEIALNDQVSRYQDKIDWLKSKGVKDNDPQMVQAMKNLQVGTEILQDPAKRLKILERQRDNLSKFSNPDAKRQAERLDAKIDRIHEEIRQEKKTKEEQQFRAGESAKDRAARAEESAKGRDEEIVETSEGFMRKKNAIGKKGPRTLGESTAMMKEVPYLAKTLGVTDKEAAEILTKTKDKSDDQIMVDLYRDAFKSLGDAAQAETATVEAMKIIQKMKGKTSPQTKKVVRTGTDKKTGKKVVQYEDGTVAYAD